MQMKAFLDRLDHHAIAQAVRDAERLTSGEIRVFVSRDPAVDSVYAAQQQFDELGMQQTVQRNGVLVFIAPQSQNFAIVGDIGVHRLCGDAFWRKVAAAMEADFRTGDFTQAIVLGVAEAGRLLAEHFPRRFDDVNELPDHLTHD